MSIPLRASSAYHSKKDLTSKALMLFNINTEKDYIKQASVGAAVATTFFDSTQKEINYFLKHKKVLKTMNSMLNMSCALMDGFALLVTNMALLTGYMTKFFIYTSLYYKKKHRPRMTQQHHHSYYNKHCSFECNCCYSRVFPCYNLLSFLVHLY